MSEDLERLQEFLVRQHLGKLGIHGLTVNQETRTIEVYVDENANIPRIVSRLRKDAGDLEIRTIKSRRARLA